MTKTKENSVDRTRIVEQISDLSRLLGRIPGDGTIAVNEPMTHNSMKL